MPASLPRSSGVLLHPTSLPGPYGIGDLGPEAYRWVKTLAAAKQTWWQVLPLGPTGFGDSPYQSYSAFAGNVNLLSPDLLLKDGLVTDTAVAGHSFPNETVQYERVGAAKRTLVREAWARFKAGSAQHLQNEFNAFRTRQRAWLPDYALFMAARESFGGGALVDWPDDVRLRRPAALAQLERALANEVMVHTFGQYLFDRQWSALRAVAREYGVRIIGDAPIFVSADSSDVWANADQFLLDDHGRPRAVAGVPPDYFCEDGQLWGNPLYDWERMAETGYAWWTARMRRQLEQVDLIRLDHFRGFAAAWHVPPGEPTAKSGEWVDGPRGDLFEALNAKLGKLPLIAEDLGLITPDVHALREQFRLPGMCVLQFALGDPDNPYWPHNYTPDSVVYTGTHDNDTTVGWWRGLSDTDRRLMADYVGHPFGDPHWELIRMAWSSVSELAIAPLQDLIGLGSEARMNTPGHPAGNWRWRVTPEQFGGGVLERLAEQTVRYNRAPKPRE